MKLSFLFFLLVPVVSIIYVLWHVWRILPLGTPWRIAVVGVLALCLITFFGNFGLWNLDKLPIPLATTSYEVGNSSMMILMYAAMAFLVLDLGRLLRIVPPTFLEHSMAGTAAIATLLIGVFTYGYFHYMHKVRMPMALTTEKPLPQPLRIVMLSDLHLGYHNRVGEVSRWMQLINAEKPDLVLIAGDIIDRNIRPLRVERMDTCFRKLQAPVVACLGNHEYYTGSAEARQFYKDAGIHLLIDSTITVKGINIVGRDDRTNRRRKSLAALMQGVDRNRYTILLDHQPYHLEEAEREKIDFQLSGHTHYGQLWPASWIEDAIYEDAYGPLRKSGTQIYVSSGMGIWGGKFRIGTQSEYIVAELKAK